MFYQSGSVLKTSTCYPHAENIAGRGPSANGLATVELRAGQDQVVEQKDEQDPGRPNSSIGISWQISVARIQQSRPSNYAPFAIAIWGVCLVNVAYCQQQCKGVTTCFFQVSNGHRNFNMQFSMFGDPSPLGLSGITSW